MDAGRLSRGELIAGISGVALFIFMFFKWYGVSGAPGGVNAWQSFGFIDIVLLLTVIVAVGFAIATAAAQNVNLPVAGAALTAGLGIIATLLVLYRLIDPPGLGVDLGQFNEIAGTDIALDVTRKIGVWLGLIASAGIAFGGWTAMQEQGGGPGGGASN